MPEAHISRRRALLLAAGGLAAVPLLGVGQAFADTSTSAKPRVYIDPGHGGTDPGAVGNGLQEKNLTLAIALGVRDHLNANWDVDIRMSRTTDLTRSLSYRSSDANSWGADVFVSVHINAGGGTGFESFRYTSASAGAVALQNAMHPQILAGMRSVSSITDRGKKSGNLHVLRETRMPAILTENLFIDRAADAALLKSSAFLAATARGHAQGIAQYLGLGGGTPSPTWPTLRNGASGENVRTLQYLLLQHNQNLVVDGSFGPATESAVRAVQSSRNLTADGVVGPKTWTSIVVTRRQGDNGDAVRGIQRSLSSKHGIATTVDGNFGAGTNTSVRTFQSRKKLVVDGVVGPLSWQALLS